MSTNKSSIMKAVFRLVSLCFRSFALVGFVAGFLYSLTQAAEGDLADFANENSEVLTCSPPNDWNQTTRVKNPQKPTKEWTFSVDDSEMDVRLVFFYYQDYDRSGCPYDCSTGECQTDETGKGTSPLGNFTVLDGKLGANRGVKQLQGRLSQGTYTVTFTANGDPGSLNAGLQVHQESPTFPTDTPIPTVIIPTTTPTPTATEPKPSPTPTRTDIAPSPSPTKPGLPKMSPTPTTPKHTPPATLAPPTPFPGSVTPMILIPETGTGLEARSGGTGFNGWLIPLGIGFIGIGMVFYGITSWLKKR
jgi:hypothetical protein